MALFNVIGCDTVKVPALLLAPMVSRPAVLMFVSSAAESSSVLAVVSTALPILMALATVLFCRLTLAAVSEPARFILLAISVASPVALMVAPDVSSVPLVAESVKAPLTVKLPGLRLPLACVIETPVNVLPKDPPVFVKLLATLNTPVPPTVPLLWLYVVVFSAPSTVKLPSAIVSVLLKPA